MDKRLLTEVQFVQEHTELVEAWDGVGFLENEWAPELETDYDRVVMAQLLENTKNMLAPMWADATPEQALAKALEAQEQFGITFQEATTPTSTTYGLGGATNLPIVLGYVRKIMPKMIALNLVGLQALDRPTGRVFFLNRYRHYDGTDKGKIEDRAGWTFRSWTKLTDECEDILTAVKIKLTSANVTAQTRKILAETCLEFEQDLKAYHGMNAVALITDAATDEIAAEIDEYILHWLWASATGGTVYVGAKPGAYTYDEWDKKLVEGLNRATELVNSACRVVPNWIVAGSEMCVRLGMLAGFDAYEPRTPARLGLRRIGTLLNTWDVYKMPLPWPTHTALLGYKGAGWVDAGAYWLPYVPLILAGSHFEPRNQTRVLSWMRRDAKYMVNTDTFALVTIDEANYTGISAPAFAEYARCE